MDDLICVVEAVIMYFWYLSNASKRHDLYLYVRPYVFCCVVDAITIPLKPSLPVKSDYGIAYGKYIESVRSWYDIFALVSCRITAP